LRKWLRKSGLAYHSPHKFRHGHAVYAIHLAKDIGALKAVSQNLMHSNLSITDGTYGAFSDRDVSKEISRLGGEGTGKALAISPRAAELLANLLSELGGKGS